MNLVVKIRIFHLKYDCISLFHVKIVFLTHVFKKKIDRHYSLVKVNEKRVYEKDALFYYLQHAKNEFEKLVFEKIAKNCFSCVAYFPSNPSVCRNNSSH